MKTKQASYSSAAVYGAIALTALLLARPAQAGGRGGPIRPDGGPVVVIDDRGAKAETSKSSKASRGADDGANHDANDDRGVRRNGADDPANHEAGDDNNNHRRGRGR